MPRRPELRLQPASSHQYYGFYLQGFEQVLGRAKLRFAGTTSPAPAQAVSGIGIEVEGRRIWIGAGDNALIEEEPLAWCDVYGVVNVLPHQLEASPKLVPIGPSFGIRWGSAAHTAAYVARAALAARQGPRTALARLQGSLSYHRDRLPLAAYDEPARSEDRYVFYAATYWMHDRPPPPARAHFIEAAKRIGPIRFEGGFAPSGRSAGAVDPALLAPRSYPLEEYLAKLRASACTFNTPAVWDCLGWKLGENLALGKAIITTPLERVLPEPFVHGTHVHVVPDDVDAMAEAIERVATDAEYRTTLERGARAYWDRWLRPDRVARRLLEHPIGR